MALGNRDGLMVVRSRHQSPLIETDVPVHEITSTVMSGSIVIVKNAFASSEIRQMRTLIDSAQIPVCEPSFDNDTQSWRDRREKWVTPDIDVLYEASFFAVTNPDDEIGQAMRTPVERLATYWRSLTGYNHTFVSGANHRALRPWAMYYPAGGGCFGWHAHGLEPTKIGIILALSEKGVDYSVGGTEFRTPCGLINVEPHHDIGDICLFRYDLQHRVTAVDPEQKLLWDGSGRWTMLIQGDPRPSSGESSSAL